MDNDLSSRPVVTTSWRQRLLLIGFGLLVWVVFVLLAEGTLKQLGVGDPYLHDDPFVGFVAGRDLFELRGDRYHTHPDKLAFFNPQSFAAAKPANSYRIFTLGGSTTAGRPYDHRVAFSSWLQIYLEDADPSHPWEVINAGAISYASYRVAVLMQELLRYQPDLLVVYTGHNEFLEERSYADIAHRHPLLKRVQAWLTGWRSFTLARQSWLEFSGNGSAAKPGNRLPAEVSARLDGWTGVDQYHRDDPLRAAVLEHFEFNLRRMSRLAREHGVQLIFIRPIANLRDFSPFKSEHGSGVSATDRVAFLVRLERGKTLLDQGQPAAAVASLAEAVAIDGQYAEAHYRLGRARLALGEHQAATASLLLANELDIAPLRALQQSDQVLRQVCKQEQVTLIDLRALLEQESLERNGNILLGDDYLLDHVHPDIPVHSQLAELLLDEFERQRVLRPRSEWNDSRRQQLYAEHLAGLDTSYYARRDLNLAKVLGWSGKIEEARAPLERAAAALPEEPEVHLNLGIVYQRSGQFEAAEQRLRRAVELAPEMPEVHFNHGVVLGRRGRLEEGIAALQEALALRPEYGAAHFNLAVLLRQAGRLTEADQQLTRARQLHPGTTEVLREAAFLARDSGRLEEATDYLRQVLAQRPADLESRVALAVVRARSDDLGAARQLLEEVLELDPPHLEARYNLALVAARQGRVEAATTAYEELLERVPWHAGALNNLALIHAGKGRSAAAKELLLRAIDAAPEYAAAHFNLGVVFDQAGQPQAAIEAIDRALELEPENPRFNLARGSYYLAVGDSHGARVAFAKAQAGGLEIPAAARRRLGL